MDYISTVMSTSDITPMQKYIYLICAILSGVDFNRSAFSAKTISKFSLLPENECEEILSYLDAIGAFAIKNWRQQEYEQWELDRKNHPPEPRGFKVSRKKRRIIEDVTSGHCAYCGNKHPEKNMTIDTLVSKKDGGENIVSNFLLVCHGCGSGKRNKTLSEFREFVSYRVFFNMPLTSVQIASMKITQDVSEIEKIKSMPFWCERTLGMKVRWSK